MPVYATTFRGTINSATVGEIFSHSHGVESAAGAQVVAEAMRTHWTTAWGVLSSFFGAEIKYEEATAASVLDPMVPDLGAAWHAAFSPALAGTAIDNSILPSQNAIAVSLTAGNRPDGRPFKGRFYLPPPHQDLVDANGLLSSAQTLSIANGIKGYMDAMNAAGHVVTVWSRTTEDLVNPVNQVRVGNKLDTIRSRRNAQPEVYSTVAIVGPQ